MFCKRWKRFQHGEVVFSLASLQWTGRSALPDRNPDSCRLVPFLPFVWSGMEIDPYRSGSEQKVATGRIWFLGNHSNFILYRQKHWKVPHMNVSMYTPPEPHRYTLFHITLVFPPDLFQSLHQINCHKMALLRHAFWHVWTLPPTLGFLYFTRYDSWSNQTHWFRGYGTSGGNHFAQVHTHTDTQTINTAPLVQRLRPEASGHTPATAPGTTASQPVSRRQTPAAGPRSYTRHSSRHAAQINDNRARCNQCVATASYHTQTNKPLEKRE